MINSIKDLQNRTSVESSTLKSFVFAKNHSGFTPSMNDIVIHDYQMANSITLNSILSNFIVDLKYAWDLYYNRDLNPGESYFQIVNADEDTSILTDRTKLLLMIDDDNASFYSRNLVLKSEKLPCDDGISQFLNLDSIWYGIQTCGLVHEDDVFSYQQIRLINVLNDQNVNPNGFGCNPFDRPITLWDKDDTKIKQYQSFNSMLKQWCIDNKKDMDLVQIQLNYFCGSRFLESDERANLTNVVSTIVKSRYLVCLSSGLYGIQLNFGDSGIVQSCTMYDIGKNIPNIKGNYDYVSTSFVDMDGELTLFIVFKDNDNKYFYTYFNEELYDKVYGFTPIRQLVSDGIVVNPSDVFNQVVSFKELDTTNIALTDYGFWDVETNKTNELTYSYRGNKTYGLIEPPQNKYYRRDKIVFPSKILSDTDKVVEYDKIWSLNDDKYYNTDYGLEYLQTIFREENHEFIGGNDQFAVYNSDGYNEPPYLLIRIEDFDRYNRLLFSDQTLVRYLIKWMYKQVTHPDEGEYYLMVKYHTYSKMLNEILTDVRYDNQSYQVQMSDNLVGSKFNSIPNLINEKESDSNKLQKYSSDIYDIIYGDTGFNWLMSEDALKSRIKVDFHDGVYRDKYLSALVNDTITDMISEYKFLLYFRSYLHDKLMHDLDTIESNDITLQNKFTVLANVIDYIKSLVPTSLVLGGYDKDECRTKEGNDKYPELKTYIYNNFVTLDKSAIQEIYSSSNIQSQIMGIVMSAPFFNDYSTYQEIYENMNSVNLFKIQDSNGFAAISGLVDRDSKLKVNWDAIKTWLFSQTQQSKETILKALFRTQFYRPMYFKYKANKWRNYLTFTDEPNIWNCTVDKFYENHLHEMKKLLFQTGTTKVDKELSGLARFDKYEVNDIEWNSTDNVISYNMYYLPLEITDDKFVFEDVEYYCVRLVGDKANVSSIYFNDFQTVNYSDIGEILVQKNEEDQLPYFELKEVKYQIEKDGDKTILRMQRFEHFDDEFRQEIVDDRFNVDGIWYVLVKDSSGEYAKVKVSETQDTNLVRIGVSPSTDKRFIGICRYKDLEFRFTSATEVYIVKFYHANVIDRVKTEWCEYDDVPSSEFVFDDDRTFEWYYANKILEMMNSHPEKKVFIKSLGGGNLYDGGLDVNNFRLSINHSIQDGVVLSRGVLTRVYDGKTEEIDIGNIFDENFNQVQGKIIQGELVNGLIDTTGGKSKTFIIKNINEGRNNINSVWVNTSLWNSNVKIIGFDKDPGTVEVDEDETNIVVRFKSGVGDVELTYSEEYEEYIIDGIDDDQHRVQEVEGIISYVSGGVRCQVNIVSKEAKKLVFNEMTVSTVDFSTGYDYASIRNLMFSTMKQYMLNEFAQRIIDNGDDDIIYFDVQQSRLNMYLELCSDLESLTNYQIVTNETTESDGYIKYSQVFKNLVTNVNDLGVLDGKIYKYLSGLIDDTFGLTKNTLTIVDSPSVQVTRLTNGKDMFTYQMQFDLHIKSTKDVISQDGKYCVGNVVVKDLTCDVQFIPEFNLGQSNPIKYTVNYVIENKNSASCKYDQITYQIGKEKKYKFIPTKTINFNFVGKTCSVQVTDGIITKQMLSEHIENIFTNDYIRSTLNDINSTSLSTFPDEYVEYVEYRNKNEPGRIWRIGAPVPAEANPQLTRRGNVIISGNGYTINEDDTLLLPQGDGYIYNISQLPAHKYDSEENESIEQVYVPISQNDFITQSYLQEKFTIVNTSDGDMCASYVIPNLPISAEKQDITYTLKSYDPQSPATGSVSTNTKQFWIIDAPFDPQGVYEESGLTLGVDMEPDSPFSIYSEAASGSFSFALGGFTNVEPATPDADEEDPDAEIVIDPPTIGFDNNWKGKPGSITINFSGLDTGSPSVSYSGFTTCTRIMTDEVPGEKLVISEEPHQEQECPNVIEYVEYTLDTSKGSPLIYSVSADGGVYTIEFSLRMKATHKTIAAIPESGTYFENIYVVSRDNISRGCKITDPNGEYPIGNNGIMLCPTNISNSITNISQVEWIRVYIEFNNGKITSGGKHCPFKLEVASCDGYRKHEWDVFNRFYTIGESVYAKHVQIDASTPNDAFWYERQNILKSQRTLPSDLRYLGLMPQGCSVSQMMIDSVTNYINAKIGLTDEYFHSVTLQIQQFMDLIHDELNQAITKSDIVDICNFTYDSLLNFKDYSITNSKWKDSTSGLFGWNRTQEPYTRDLETFNAYLYGEFSGDHSKLQFDSDRTEVFDDKDYPTIVVDNPSEGFSAVSMHNIYKFKIATLDRLFKLLNHKLKTGTDLIEEIFHPSWGEGFNDDMSESVRWINTVRTNLSDPIDSMYIFDEQCHLFTRDLQKKIKWFSFNCSTVRVQGILDDKMLAEGTDYWFSPEQKWISGFDIRHDDWYFRFANRDLMKSRTSEITDAYIVRCIEKENPDIDYWHLSSIDGCIYAPVDKILDIAYEEYGNSTYVLFYDDNRIYRYDNLNQMVDFDGMVSILKSQANMVIETFHSALITETEPNVLDWMCLDYMDSKTQNRLLADWNVNLFGRFGERIDQETWYGNPGEKTYHFKNYNTIIFGDSLFDENQLRFQNISKKKEMFDILDIDEIDGCYYGLFKDYKKSAEYGQDIYTIFKTAINRVNDASFHSDLGVVEKMPFDVIIPRLFRSKDSLYSLWVVVRNPTGTTIGENGDFIYKYDIQLQEISTPNSELYLDNIINLSSIIDDDELDVFEVLMSEFVTQSNQSYLYTLTNSGFDKIYYDDKFKHISIDSVDELKGLLQEKLRNVILDKHMKDMHSDDGYFNKIAGKVNQLSPSFSMWDLIPTEFSATQDVGVIPDSPIDDDDTETKDHRVDSVIVSTDILQSDGMVKTYETNPGFVSCAVSNPATTYEDESVYLLSQRNSLLDGSEFYDFIYDQDGNVLMDLFSVPFIYRINSNNTYDLYINVPTTRTKYLNRITGTLNPDLTSQVLATDSRDRRNFLNESIPNNLDESTTKLRVYIDRKFISIGNVELVEISGNSIPLEIYRDVPNDGLYDSIALEGRWTGEIEEINDTSKDINKVMLEFEVYGTDSQSIHITGKTLVNSFLDDDKYIFGK